MDLGECWEPAFSSCAAVRQSTGGDLVHMVVCGHVFIWTVSVDTTHTHHDFILNSDVNVWVFLAVTFTQQAPSE